MSSYYGASGDIRADLNGGIPSTHQNYMGEDQVPGALIERGRRYAYSMINSKLKPRYDNAVPWTPGSEPALIYEISNMLSQYFVISKQNLGNEPLDKKKVKELYDEPIKMLDDLAKGDAELEELGSPIGTSAYYTHKNRTPVFDVDNIENSKIDEDLLDDIADART